MTTTSKKETILYFGSFNPIHNGHMALAEYALSNTDAEELWFVLSPQNPLKQQSGLWDDDLRLKLARAATANSTMRVCDIEFGLPKPNYTYRTLDVLTTRYPERVFSILIGADNYEIFDHWKHYQTILENHKIYVYPRKDTTPDFTKFPQMEWLNAPLYPISSTEIRDNMTAGKPISGMVPQAVEEILQTLPL